MKKDISRIPKGTYCYARLRITRKGQIKVVGLCPYWSQRKNKPKHENGYCDYLKKGDWDLNKEKRWSKAYDKSGKKVKTKWQNAKEIGFPMSLLWEQVKECNINEGGEIE